MTVAEECKNCSQLQQPGESVLRATTPNSSVYILYFCVNYFARRWYEVVQYRIFALHLSRCIVLYFFFYSVPPRCAIVGFLVWHRVLWLRAALGPVSVNCLSMLPVARFVLQFHRIELYVRQVWREQFLSNGESSWGFRAIRSRLPPWLVDRFLFAAVSTVCLSVLKVGLAPTDFGYRRLFHLSTRYWHC